MNPAPIVEAGMQKLFTEFNTQFAGAVWPKHLIDITLYLVKLYNR